MDDLSREHPDLEPYFDGPEGNLPERVRQHLADCDACSSELASLTRLRARARLLPAEIRPSRDLWPAIATRVAGPASAAEAGVTPIRRPAARAGSAPRWHSLAAAAVVLVVISATATAVLLRGSDDEPMAVVASPPAEARPAGLAAFASADVEYRHTVETLEAELDARRGELSPTTVAAVEQNLAIIDNAIAEARRALAADPTSADLPLLLSGVYRRKVELLRQAVDLSARS
jgi:hypothetical protein